MKLRRPQARAGRPAVPAPRRASPGAVRRFLGLWLGWMTGLAAWAAQRFPPPEFEGGYVIPTTRFPPPRGLWLEYLDVGVLVLCLGLASWLVLRQRSRKAVVGLSLFSLAYFGFYRKGCICAIGSTQNVALALADPGYHVPLVVLLFFALPLLTALFFGRSFCAAVCPHGALQDLVLVKPVRVPSWVENALGLLPFIFLGAGVWLAASGGVFLVCRLDPFVPIFRRSGSLTMLLLGVGFVVAGMFVGRPYCRFACPYGALLRLGSMVSRWRVRITPDVCTQCRLCESTCPFGVIREPAGVPAMPGDVGRERGRFLKLVVLLPALVLAGGWVGSRLAGPAATLNSEVRYAEEYLLLHGSPGVTNLPTADQLALGRIGRASKESLAGAVATRHRLGTGGWWFGGFVGLVIGVRLLGLSFWRRRSDYEPDRGGCVGCARCFLSCPQERVRCGLMTPEAAAAAMTAAATATRAPASISAPRATAP